MAVNLPFSLHLLFILFLLFLSSQTHCAAYAAKEPKNASQDLVRSSCVHASYPSICLRTLSSYAGPGNTTPRDLAQAAVKVSLSRAHKASVYLATLRGSGSKRERAALRDCVDQVADSVSELRKTVSELKHLRRGTLTFRWHMSNAKTWVSAALTNEDTCLDGFRELLGGKVRSDVKRKIGNVARVTSNALYLINRLDHTPPNPTVSYP